MPIDSSAPYQQNQQLLNQRSAERKPLRTSGLISIDGGEPFRFDTIDISLGGIGINVQKQLVNGQNCFVKFSLFINGKGVDIIAAAKITHTVFHKDGFKTGLQFIKLSATNEGLITKFINR